MADKKAGVWKNSVWNLLDEYADFRDELDDVRLNLQELHAGIEDAIDEITEELEQLQAHLDKCDGELRKFLHPAHGWFNQVRENQDTLPFSD